MSTLALTRASWSDLNAGGRAPGVVFGFARLAAIERVSFIEFHVFSFADFFVAEGKGFAFTRLDDPLMDTLEEVPMAIIPLFGVPVTGAFSLMMLHWLLTRGA